MQSPVKEIQQVAGALARGFPGVAVASAPVGDPDQPGEMVGLVRREVALCAQHRNPRRRAEFVAGRNAARAAVVRLLGIEDLNEIEILKDATGAPFVVNHPNVRVSITHSNQVAVAVAAFVPVGVDLEADEARPPAFSRMFFSRNEQQSLSAAPGHDQQTMLNTLWTRKEAICKVGRWGGTLAFAAVDCLGSDVRVADSAITVKSASAAGYVLSIAAERQGSRHDG
jgi:4'-phosphopantetheinyl transferase